MQWRKISVRDALRSCCILGIDRVGLGSDHGYLEAEYRPGGFGRLEVYRAVMPLQDLISLCQPDAAAFFLGREVKFENLVVQFFRDATALILDFRQDQPILSSC